MAPLKPGRGRRPRRPVSNERTPRKTLYQKGLYEAIWNIVIHRFSGCRGRAPLQGSDLSVARCRGQLPRCPADIGSRTQLWTRRAGKAIRHFFCPSFCKKTDEKNPGRPANAAPSPPRRIGTAALLRHWSDAFQQPQPLPLGELIFEVATALGPL